MTSGPRAGNAQTRKGYSLIVSKSHPNWTSRLKLVELLVPSGMTTALLGILVDGGGGLTLEILVMLGLAG